MAYVGCLEDIHDPLQIFLLFLLYLVAARADKACGGCGAKELDLLLRL